MGGMWGSSTAFLELRPGVSHLGTKPFISLPYQPCHRPSFHSTLSLTSQSTSLSSLSSTFYLQAIDLAWLPSDPAAQRGEENRLQDGSSRDDVDRGRPHWLPSCVFVLLGSDSENTTCSPATGYHRLHCSLLHCRHLGRLAACSQPPRRPAVQPNGRPAYQPPSLPR